MSTVMLPSPTSLTTIVRTGKPDFLPERRAAAVLLWEDEDEYRRLIEALRAEHKPQGPTEEHLVDR